MRLITPIPFAPGQLISTTATDSTPAYNPATSYGVGDIVYVGTRRYESLEAGNTGNNPPDFPDKWLDIGPTNPYAMFDDVVSTQTTGSSPLEVVVYPGQIFNSIAILNMSGGTSLTVEVTDTGSSGAPVIYSETISLDGSIIDDWYDYFFEPFSSRRDAVFTGIPPYSTGQIRVTMVGGGTLAIGAMLYGNMIDLGCSAYGVRSGIRDYSVKQTDQFGNTVFVERNYSKRMTSQVMVTKVQFSKVSQVLSDIRATPTIFIGSDDPAYDPLIIYGYVRDWNLEITYPAYSILSIEIEGLI